MATNLDQLKGVLSSLQARRGTGPPMPRPITTDDALFTGLTPLQKAMAKTDRADDRDLTYQRQQHLGSSPPRMPSHEARREHHDDDDDDDAAMLGQPRVHMATAEEQVASTQATPCPLEDHSLLRYIGRPAWQYEMTPAKVAGAPDVSANIHSNLAPDLSVALRARDDCSSFRRYAATRSQSPTHRLPPTPSPLPGRAAAMDRHQKERLPEASLATSDRTDAAAVREKGDDGLGMVDDEGAQPPPPPLLEGTAFRSRQTWHLPGSTLAPGGSSDPSRRYGIGRRVLEHEWAARRAAAVSAAETAEGKREAERNVLMRYHVCNVDGRRLPLPDLNDNARSFLSRRVVNVAGNPPEDDCSRRSVPPRALSSWSHSNDGSNVTAMKGDSSIVVVSQRQPKLNWRVAWRATAQIQLRDYFTNAQPLMNAIGINDFVDAALCASQDHEARLVQSLAEVDRHSEASTPPQSVAPAELKSLAEQISVSFPQPPLLALRQAKALGNPSENTTSADFSRAAGGGAEEEEAASRRSTTAMIASPAQQQSVLESAVDKFLLQHFGKPCFQPREDDAAAARRGNGGQAEEEGVSTPHAACHTKGVGAPSLANLWSTEGGWTPSLRAMWQNRFRCVIGALHGFGGSGARRLNRSSDKNINSGKEASASQLEKYVVGVMTGLMDSEGVAIDQRSPHDLGTAPTTVTVSQVEQRWAAFLAYHYLRVVPAIPGTNQTPSPVASVMADQAGASSTLTRASMRQQGPPPRLLMPMVPSTTSRKCPR